MQVSLKVWGGRFGAYTILFCLLPSKRKPLPWLIQQCFKTSSCFSRHTLLEGVKGILLKCHWLLHFRVYVNLFNKCWYICCLLFQRLEVIFLYHMYLYICVCTWADVCVVYFVHMYVSSFVPGVGIWKMEDHPEYCLSATIDLTVLLPRNLANRAGCLSSKMQRSS